MKGGVENLLRGGTLNPKVAICPLNLKKHLNNNVKWLRYDIMATDNFLPMVLILVPPTFLPAQSCKYAIPKPKKKHFPHLPQRATSLYFSVEITILENPYSGQILGSIALCALGSWWFRPLSYLGFAFPSIPPILCISSLLNAQ